MDTIYTLPGLLLSVTLAFVVGRGVVNAAVALSIAYVPQYYRVVRNHTVSVKTELFIEAAQSMGAVHLDGAHPLPFSQRGSERAGAVYAQRCRRHFDAGRSGLFGLGPARIYARMGRLLASGARCAADGYLVDGAFPWSGDYSNGDRSLADWRRLKRIYQPSAAPRKLGLRWMSLAVCNGIKL